MSKNTNLDVLFRRYWKDYQEGNKIAGGLAYENQLRQYCDLNEKLDSLKELDGFLTAVRRDVLAKVTKANLKLDNKGIEDLLLQKKEIRNLLLFIGLYTGHVLAKQHNAQAKFLTQSELQNLDTQFKSDSFVYSLGVMFNQNDNIKLSDKIANINQPYLFFVYEPMIMRLCGGYDYQLTAIQGQEKIIDSLYQSVLDRLPVSIAVEKTEQKSKNTTSDNSTDIYSTLLEGQP